MIRIKRAFTLSLPFIYRLCLCCCSANARSKILMMLLKQLAFPVLLLLAGTPVAYAGGPAVDKSQAGPDGPHVFYRGKNIVVKTIEALDDTSNIVRVKYYTKREEVQLTCTLPKSGDSFTFPLQKKLKVEKDKYQMPDRMLVLSDIEGNFEAFKIMLQGAKVIDEDFNWIYGDGHLMLVGDFFDRGLNVTEVLWLIYKLEPEAEEAGGQVHFVLGNHEVMNLCGEYSYVRNKYMENAKLIGEDYSLWFDDHSELGLWLRTKNAVEKVGDYVFCHAGISPALARTTLTFRDINVIARKSLGRTYSDIADSVTLLVYNTRTGIFWFRDAAKHKISQEEMDEVLHYAGAKHIVVGHTLVPDVLAMYDGALICVDLFHDENLRQGLLKTLYIEDGRSYILDSKGVKSSVYVIGFNTTSQALDGGP
ncbi:MAG: metallophosphoesterase [Bacteroidetes bacterium]|nr:MAG: metallophosphoesterase [Bacteroidota bacterium]